MKEQISGPYRKLKDYWIEQLGGRVQKVSLHAGFSCPNRDGRIGFGGCSYCSNEAFTPSYCREEITLTEQMELGLAFQKKRYPRAVGFLAYLQAYTNTYGSMEELIPLYESILNHPEFCGLVIGTRPDCLPDELLDWMEEASKSHRIYIELGIESFSDATLMAMNRGHTFAQAEEAIQRLNERGILVGGHFLIGFPGEAWDSFFYQVDRLNRLPLHSIKVHQLHVFKKTPLAKHYQTNPELFDFPTKNDYFNTLAEWLPKLHPDLYIDRLFGDAPLHTILNPTWGLRLDLLIREFEAFYQQSQIQT